MPTPGTVVNVTTSSGANNRVSSTGTLFAIGQTKRGQVGTAISVTSLAQFIALCGTRTFNGATQTLYDAIDIFFQEGGAQAYVSRVSGPSAVVANHSLKDRAGSAKTTLKISALGPGTWGNSITVAIANGTVSNTFVITIVNGSVTEVSPNLYNPTQAVSWAQNYSQTVVITNLGSTTAAPNNNPAVISATSLTSGADTTSPADSVWVAALTAFVTADLGPGQVAAPARTTTTVWEGLANHAQAHNRFALLDAPNTTSASTIESDATTVAGAVNDPSYAFMLAPWPIYRGPATNTAVPPYPRNVAPSALVAGLMARSDASNNCDVAAAGTNGISNNAIGVTQTYSPTARSTLDAAGVGVIRQRESGVQLYGYTSMALNPTWSDVGNCRLRMQLVNGLRLIGDGFMFADIDASGHTASALGGAASAYLTTLYNQGALYGATATTAFTVNVGPSVNTPTTALARQLIESVAVRMSSTADQVLIDVTRVPVTQALPA